MSSLVWNIINVNQQVLQLAELEAQTNLNKDRAFRLWATRHGGAYLIVNEDTKPVEFLADVKERDITSPSGQTLTLYNPASMLREIMNDYSNLYGIKARITGKMYLNPENAPDAWEMKALDELSRGKKEFKEVILNDGNASLRVMQPMYMEQGCMKCHAWTGLKVGELRGGTDVTIPLELFAAFKSSSIQKLLLSHFVIWVIGFGFLFFLGRRLNRSELSTHIHEKKLSILSYALQQSANGIIITNSSGIIEYVNQAFLTINGFSESELIGTTPKKMKSGLNPPELYEEMWAAITQGYTWKGEFKNRKKNGAIYWCFETISPVFDDNNNITHYIGIIEDIQDRKTTEEHIRHLVKFDPLTNLPNRNFFRDELESRINQANSNGQSFGLLYIDLDRFKMVNDSLGHTVGDRLLQKLAERFTAMNEQNHFIVRLGGDEFAIITALVDSKKTVEIFAKNVHEAIKTPFVIDNNDIYMTASIGIALYPQDGEDSELLIKAADMGMYGAKINGKNTYLFFEPTKGDFASETLIIENGLRKALKNNELFLVYQPKWDTKEDKFIGLEVLVRWQSPDLGFMNPGQFISIAEETDLIIVLGEWILKEALNSMMELSKTIGFIPKLSVNLSPVQFRSNALNTTIKEILEETLFPAEKLELEITEGALVSNPKMAIEKMNDLVNLGITFSIDDFGTGYSSMSYLKKFPVSTLKIDKSFVDDVVSDHQDRAIIEAIITLAASLEMKTIAEGAETKEQVDILNFIGCYAIQGYWHSRPLDYAALRAYFQKLN
ncbi:MAG: EAL domain-containing protein [Sulfuricurvum sp.]|uniref:EAL domain-containing protein n=1 Tax=Sulfuricurvum sp. TaxID=2025608 RepID=UPI002736D1D7|nr:EAL domain-containing protein [Sulfuricurvum sp.]MDP2851692.1 EAL domain-containing protein [Sulfuricurvum sp.]MDP3292834.1 EAL domain-containing protein [Sulfuricurvum sp.]